MFRNILLGGFLIILLLMSNVESKSDTMVCIPDCEEDIFNFNVPAMTYSIGTCSITVYWGWRHACDMYWDIFILGISYSGPGCSYMSEKDMMDASIIKLLNDPYLQTLSSNPQSFPLPLNPGDCTTSWRVNKWKCWQKYVSITGDHRLVACNTDPEVPCCLTWYKLCMDNLGIITYTIEAIEGPDSPCIAPCVDVCD